MKKILIPILLVAACIVAFYFYNNEASDTNNEKAVKVAVQKGEFTISVMGSGELKAKRSVKIRVPDAMRSAGIYQTTISKLIPEGTVVKKGDFVSSLDKSQISDKIAQISSELDKIQTQYDQLVIDTAIEMNSLKDQIANFQFSMKEKKLQVEQSKYEPQMVIRQAEIEYERTMRDYQQLINKVSLKRIQSEAKVQEIITTLKINQGKMDKMMKLSQEFDIKAPEDGMLIYARNWNGSKQVPGSQVSSWNSTIAELPDLSDMISKTYVNEVDVSKVKISQNVEIKIDAFPDRTYSGEVISVANIGEERRDFDTKVFEVTIQLYDNDSLLRPAMTTGNEIVTYVYDSVTYIPIEALQKDSFSFVYIEKNGIQLKKEVITGESNNESIIVIHGLTGDEQVYLSTPSDVSEWTFEALDEEVKSEYIAKKAAEKERREKEQKKAVAAAKSKANALKQGMTNDNSGGGTIMIIE